MRPNCQPKAAKEMKKTAGKIPRSGMGSGYFVWGGACLGKDNRYSLPALPLTELPTPFGDRFLWFVEFDVMAVLQKKVTDHGDQIRRRMNWTMRVPKRLPHLSN